MKNIYIITENNMIITSRDTMNNAIATAINGIATCGHLCKSFNYNEFLTTIRYYNPDTNETRTLLIQKTDFKEGV